MSNKACKYHGFKLVPTELSFEVEEGSPYVPPKQVMKVKKEGTGTLPPLWKITVTYLGGDIGGDNWIKLSPKTGSVPKDIIVSVNSIGMASGVYIAEIIFNSESATNAPQYATISLNVKPKLVPVKPIKIITSDLCDGMKNEPYECQLEVSGGVAPYGWIIENLPDGLELNEETGSISGVPLCAGTFDISISVVDINGDSDTVECCINIDAPNLEVEILSPSSGDVLSIGEKHDILWTLNITDDALIDIDLICNGNCYPIVTDIPLNAFEYEWKITAGYGNNNIIRLTTCCDDIFESGVFTINQHSCILGKFFGTHIHEAINILRGR